MNDVLTWGALILAGTSIVALVRFWIDVGRQAQKIEESEKALSIAAAKNDLIMATLNEFKIEVARTYATTRALAEAEAGLVNTVRDAVQGIYSRLDNMTSRLDSLVTIARHVDKQ